MKRFVTSAILIGLIVTVPTLAQAAEILHGTVNTFVSRYLEIFEPFDIDIGGIPVNTGVVTLSLDPTKNPEDQVTSFNFGAGIAPDGSIINTLDMHTDLLIKAPILDALGAPPIPFSVTEHGTFDFDAVQINDIAIATVTDWELFSSGVIEGGLFPGAFAAAKKKCHDCPKCPGEPSAAMPGTLGLQLEVEFLG